MVRHFNDTLEPNFELITKSLKEKYTGSICEKKFFLTIKNFIKLTFTQDIKDIVEVKMNTPKWQYHFLFQCLK